MINESRVFSYCKTLNNTCSCEQGGEALCPRMIRESADEAQQQRAESEAQKQSKYIQDEPAPMMGSLPASAMMYSMMMDKGIIDRKHFGGPVARGGSYLGTIRVAVPDMDIGLRAEEAVPTKIEPRYVEVNKEKYESGYYSDKDIQRLYEHRERHSSSYHTDIETHDLLRVEDRMRRMLFDTPMLKVSDFDWPPMYIKEEPNLI